MRNPFQANEANNPNDMTNMGQMGRCFAFAVEDASAALRLISVRTLWSVSTIVSVTTNERRAARLTTSSPCPLIKDTKLSIYYDMIQRMREGTKMGASGCRMRPLKFRQSCLCKRPPFFDLCFFAELPASVARPRIFAARSRQHLDDGPHALIGDLETPAPQGGGQVFSAPSQCCRNGHMSR